MISSRSCLTGSTDLSLGAVLRVEKVEVSSSGLQDAHGFQVFGAASGFGCLRLLYSGSYPGDDLLVWRDAEPAEDLAASETAPVPRTASSPGDGVHGRFVSTGCRPEREHATRRGHLYLDLLIAATAKHTAHASTSANIYDFAGLE